MKKANIASYHHLKNQSSMRPWLNKSYRAYWTARRCVTLLAVLAVLSIVLTALTHVHVYRATQMERTLRELEVTWADMLDKAYLLLDVDDMSSETQLNAEEIARRIHNSLVSDYTLLQAQKKSIYDFCNGWRFAQPLECDQNIDLSLPAREFVEALVALNPSSLSAHLPQLVKTMPSAISVRLAVLGLRQAQDNIAIAIAKRETTARIMDIGLSGLILLLSWVLWRYQIAPSILKLDTALSDVSKREHYLSSALASSQNAVMICDANGTVLTCNPSAEQMTGYDQDEIIGKTFRDILNLQEVRTEDSVETLARLPIDTGTSNNAPQDLSSTGASSRYVALQSRHGEQLVVHESAAVIKDDSDQPLGWLLSLRDVTEEHRNRDAQESAFRLQSLGQLAAGVSHDFNNLLASVRAAAELAELEDDAAARQEYLTSITESVDRGAAMTARLRKFGQPDSGFSLRLVSPTSVCKSACGILRSTLPQNIQIVCEDISTSSVVRCDEKALENVFINLGINAASAMPDGGAITVSITPVLGHNVGAPLEQNVSYLRVNWHDTGHGIADDVIKRIFDPFFTTRRTTGGTGLGLSITANTIRNFGGHITCRSQVDAYTCFSIYLPIVQNTQLPSEPDAIRISDPLQVNSKSVRGNVLLVDDEVYLTTFIKKNLERRGTVVRVANTGEEGFEIYKTHAAEIDLVLIDQNMPGWRGSDLAQRLLEFDPNCRIAVLTGNTPEETRQEFSDVHIMSFFYKPVSLDQLATHLDQLAQLPGS